ncbi:LexA family transcriptional regulator [Fulvivirgaceae bacterium BMA10]|uniref:LexA family transcriptional regulator n=1 Tax=Splendidivirga corallicola TaxID=3051826 RepID=A0ABT8KJA3_9BACT|nr:LexA family transcriptional regulator [Fulvivirgaceae bacterium BMA10]
MSYIGKNIKKIRTVKKLSQAAFAELFNLARPSVGAYEEERAEPKIDTVIQIANYFGLSVDVLLTKELTVNELYRFDIFTDGMNVNKISGSQKLDRTHPKNGIALVNLKQYIEYIVNHQNKDFLDKLSKINLPVTFKRKSRAFQLNGSEMEYNHNGLHHGDILLCVEREKTNKKDLNTGSVYVAVHKEDIICRRLSGLSKDKLILKSDDPNYELIEVNIEDLLELWEVKGVYSTYLNPPTVVESRILQIENELIELKKKMK